MVEQRDSATDESGEAERLNRCISLVAHHEEIQVMVTVIEKLLIERMKTAESSEEEEEEEQC